MLGCWAPHTSATLTCRWFLGYITYLYVSAVVGLGMPYHRTTDVSHDLLTYLRILLCVFKAGAFFFDPKHRDYQNVAFSSSSAFA